MESNLLQKYRPAKLSELLGQTEIVRALHLFIKAPYSTAMLFHGESGTGKTSAGYALAHELGCKVEDEFLGGLYEIASGEQTADSVRNALNRLALRPLLGSGWRVLLVNEADRMSAQAETIWLDGLEHLVPKCVVIFTTNAAAKLSKRFRDRCEVYHFASGSDDLAPAIQKLACHVWKCEGLKGSPPGLDKLGMPTLGSLDSMHASFRLALQQLTRFIREAKTDATPKRMKSVAAQVARDQFVTNTRLEVQCDHCGASNDLVGTPKSVKCCECGKRFTIDWE